MFQRTLATTARRLARQFPVLTIVGPRQAGKTTLARMTFPDHAYVNLEDPDARALASTDPRGFIARYPDPLILDEIQRVPELLSSIQVEVDRAPQSGRYILTGSHQSALHAAISQSLAGRTALLQLLPLSLPELSTAAPDDLDELLLRGFLPRVHDANQDPYQAYRAYFQTYVERDLRQIMNVKNLALFQRFMRLCAGRIGQLFNASALANEVGVSYHTIEHWISALEASYLVFRLPPYFENFNKRWVKTPKLYFTEPGLATYLLGIETSAQLSRDPLRGGLFENLVIMELYKARVHRGRDPGLYFVRDRQGNEIDALLTRGRELIAVEIKSAQTYHSQMATKLNLLRRWVSPRPVEGYVVYGGEGEQAIGENHLVPYLRTATIATDTST